jgi:glycosyltransferase involved in cell wall biosynthesis
MPRVTIVTATYNWAPVLPYAIASVLDQTFEDFELLVIGDGCTDESAAVVQAVDDPRVHWHNLERNVGHQSGPNNEALRLARGQLIAYLGHDDLWLPRHLERLVAALDTGAPMAHATTVMVTPDRPPARWPGPGWVYRPGSWIPPTSLMHDRDLAVAVGGWYAPVDTGTLEPEAHLWRRMADASSAPVWVHHTTSVKLPASLRRAVYRDRPHDEQDAWLGTIRRHADPETAFEALYPETIEHRRSLSQRAVAGLREKVAIRSRLTRLGVRPETARTAEQRRLERRVFKGLDD